MIPRGQHLLRTGQLAKELGVCVPTLCRWTTEDSPSGKLWRSCMLRKGWYVVPKLRAAGLISDAYQSTNEGVCDVG